jgi:hypothetical protein
MTENNLPTLEEQASQLRQSSYNNVKETINGLYNEIVADKETSVLPERIFTEVFLEHFKSGEQMSSNDPLTLKWLELSGGPYNEVSIIDDKGNQLYTTPGLYSKPVVDTKDTKFSDIISKHNLKSNRMYEDGINYLSAELSNIEKQITNNNKEHAMKWDSVFKRYKTDKGVTEKAETTTTKQPDNTNDFLEYD